VSGLVDPYLLGEIKTAFAVVGVCAILALLVWACTRIPDRWLGTTLAAVAGWVAATWFAVFVRKHTRPREGD
jgi:hypothetical protein